MSKWSSAEYVASPNWSCEVQLNATAVVGQMRERRFAVRAPRHDSSGIAHRVPPSRWFVGVQTRSSVREVRPIETICERADALRD